MNFKLKFKLLYSTCSKINKSKKFLVNIKVDMFYRIIKNVYIYIGKRRI